MTLLNYKILSISMMFLGVSIGITIGYLYVEQDYQLTESESIRLKQANEISSEQLTEYKNIIASKNNEITELKMKLNLEEQRKITNPKQTTKNGDNLTVEDIYAIFESDDFVAESKTITEFLQLAHKVCKNVPDKLSFFSWLLFLGSGVGDKILIIKENINNLNESDVKEVYRSELKKQKQVLDSLDKCADSLDKYLK